MDYETVTVKIINLITTLRYSIEKPKSFDKALKELRQLYLEYPKCFSEGTIDEINSYKESSCILRNMKPSPYIFDVQIDCPKSDHKYFNRVKRR